MDQNKSKKPHRSVFERLDSMPWYLQFVQFWVVGILGTVIFIWMGFDARISGVAGMIGINLVVFTVIAYLANSDKEEFEHSSSE